MAVVEAVSHRKLPELFPREGVFAERHAVFVTLHVRDRLQGCIGVIEAKEPLGEAIVRCAASAALEDPRFAPMKQEQLDELSIEISLLSPMEPIDPEAIEIGHHGLFVHRSEEHTSELQSHSDLVCRLLLEKKK